MLEGYLTFLFGLFFLFLVLKALVVVGGSQIAIVERKVRRQAHAAGKSHRAVNVNV